MKTGIELIKEERQKQIKKHGFTAEHHSKNIELYENYQLQLAASCLLIHEFEEQPEVDQYTPEGWNKEWFIDLNGRSRKDRLIIAGALIAAELDRITILEVNSI